VPTLRRQGKDAVEGRPTIQRSVLAASPRWDGVVVLHRLNEPFAADTT
jgi:hypothetical protein